MVRSFVYGLAILVSSVLIAGVELTFIKGNVAALILASGALVALAFSLVQQRKGGAVSDGRQEAPMEVETPVGKFTLASERSLMIFALAAAGYFGYIHHTSSHEDMAKVRAELAALREATAENTYVLSLSQAEREGLRIVMPESLRRKMRERAVP